MARKSRKNTNVQPEASCNAALYIRTALYIRLSVEDNKKHGYSLDTQRLILEDYLAGRPEMEVCGTYVDNGATGTNFDRTGFRQMLADIEVGLINCVIVKDLSRLGRNVIDTGYYIERYFPAHKVRFVAVNDNFDSGNPDNLFGGIILPLKNMIKGRSGIFWIVNAGCMSNTYFMRLIFSNTKRVKWNTMPSLSMSSSCAPRWRLRPVRRGRKMLKKKKRWILPEAFPTKANCLRPLRAGL